MTDDIDMFGDIEWSAAVCYAIPLRTRFRGILVREGMLLRGPLGWAEFCPFTEYDDRECVPWLATAVEQASVGWPPPVRDRIPVNATVPAVGPAQAHRIVVESGCSTVKVKVADHPRSLPEDQARVAAVRAALGPKGRIRIDANGRWDVETAVDHITRLDRAAGRLEYVEQPCASIPELAAVRRQVPVRIAADESIRRAEDPLQVAVAEAADVAVIKCTPLGGVRRALQVAEAAGLPCVVSSALETGVGLTAQIALAAALPQLDFACGLATTALFEHDLVAQQQQWHPVDGAVRVPAGIAEPDPELLERFRMRDTERVAWWQQRLARVRALLP